MNDDGVREQSVSGLDRAMSLSRQTSLSAQDTSNWSRSSARLGTFDFTSAPSDVSIPSFDPALAAFADLSFTPQPSSSSMTKDLPPPDAFSNRDSHDKKRLKMESETPALDSIDYWISFDDDLDKLGSFEIDYSKRCDPINQTRPGVPPESIPGLGSGLYSTATAPFREEDFFDDSAFEQVLSDDEELSESAAKSKQRAQPISQQSFNNENAYFQKPENLDESQSTLRLAPTVKDAPRHARGGACEQSTEFDEQRRYLEEALSSGRIPGALIPPNGFGIGFGAGMGGSRPPQEFENQSFSPRSQGSDAQVKSTAAISSDKTDESEAVKQTKRVTATKASSSKKAALGATSKVRSADRIAHNDVERKYRTNLKDRIAELRAAVPALHTSGGDADSEGGSAGAQQGSVKISKGTVLTKATEYIHQLESKNRAIMQEHQQLARRLQAFETLLNSTGRQTEFMMPNHSMTLFDPRGFC